MVLREGDNKNRQQVVVSQIMGEATALSRLCPARVDAFCLASSWLFQNH
jgi:hypothetical protein